VTTSPVPTAPFGDPLELPVGSLPGLRGARTRLLEAAGIRTLLDLALHLPFRYEDRSHSCPIAGLRIGQPASFAARISRVLTKPNRFRRVPVHEVLVEDGSGQLRAVWFGQKWIDRALCEGVEVSLFGTPLPGDGPWLRLENPEWEVLPQDATEDEGIHVGRIVPIHRRIAPPGEHRPLVGKLLRRLLRDALRTLPAGLEDPVPAALASAHGWPGRREALVEAHFPGSTGEPPDPDRLASLRLPARERLAFEELLALQVRLVELRRRRIETERAPRIESAPELRRELGRLVPFSLTGAQQKALSGIASDLASGHPMARLLQGDVGSGKTIVALLSLALAARGGFQGALMAPTAILAEQHAAVFARILEGSGIGWALLTGQTRGARRTEILEGLRSGAISIVVGTHALIEDPVGIPRLALAVVDEQHRFGVVHRERLLRKGMEGETPHLLVMTATPIPRSLSLTLYGDLDVSLLDELPPGRKPVRTFLREGSARERVFRFVAGRIAAGERAYVVYPFVEESAKLADVRALFAAGEEELARLLPGVAVARVHGRMKADERGGAMASFASGRTPVLLATTVIEVGVDVPEATVMVVENAERFGLSQLHQLRGRVGRGERDSWCVLIAGEGCPDEARRRLDRFSALSDGFAVAEADLESRGPGEIFGRRQSGAPELRVANPLRRLDLVQLARDEAEAAAREGRTERLARLLAPWGFETEELERG
jgi:ATP-dependent DNA helicase RecG